MRLILRFLLFIICLISISNQANSTHIVGGELNYRYIGSNNYEISLTVYRDCYNGVPLFDDPAGVGIFDANNNLVNTLLMNFMGSDTIEPTINAPCFVPPVNVCYEVTTYIDTINLAPSTGGYQLVYQRCCRNQTILNIINPVNTGATYYANIPGTGLATNNSNPVFTNWPPPFICNYVPFVFDHSATDIDGDSIVYELCTPYDGATVPIPQPIPPFSPPYTPVSWASPFSLANIIGTIPPLSIDAQTGILTVTPNILGQFVLAVCAKEFRNGNLISTTRRDFQLNVVNCPTLLVAAINAPTYTCGTNTVSFQNFSIGANAFFWDFGDTTTLADTSHLPIPTYTYPDTGAYAVMMIAKSPLNPSCIDTTVDTIYILPDYIVDFQAYINPCSYTVNFTDTSNLDSGPTVDWYWNFGDSTTSTMANPIHTFPGPGTYNVLFTGVSARGCEESIVKQIEIPDLMDVSRGPITPTLCFGDCTASASVSVINGIPPFSYLWSDASSQMTPTATNLCAGTYVVTISDSFGCSANDTILIPDAPQLISTPLTSDAYCGGMCFGTATANATGGTPPYSFLWSDATNQTSAKATSLCPGTYTVIITDNNACTRVDTAVVFFSNSKPVVNAGASLDTLFGGQSTQLFATNAPGYVHNWTPSGSLNQSNIPNPIATPIENTNYIVTISDSNGCTNADTVSIILKGTTCDEPEIFIPNAITPNGDNVNDVVYVRGQAVREILFRVYNRWGEMIFESRDKNIGWDAYHNSELVQPGVYVYYVKVSCYGNGKFEKKGNISVIR